MVSPPFTIVFTNPSGTATAAAVAELRTVIGLAVALFDAVLDVVLDVVWDNEKAETPDTNKSTNVEANRIF